MSFSKWLCWIKGCTLPGAFQKDWPKAYSYSVWEYWAHHTLVSLGFYNFKVFVNICNHWLLVRIFFLYLLALFLWQNFNFLWAGVHLFDVLIACQHLLDAREFKLLRKGFCYWNYKINRSLSIWEENSKSQFLL